MAYFIKLFNIVFKNTDFEPMIIKKIDAFIRKIVMSKNWDIQATVFVFTIMHFVSFPTYNLEYDNWSDQYEKSSRIFSNM